MDQSLTVHVSFLSRSSIVFTEEERNRAELNRIETDIRAAELALVYYRKALELEQQLTPR